MAKEPAPTIPEPAFPVPTSTRGMSTRACFAMVMMGAEVSKQGGGGGSSEEMAKKAVKHTDALLKALHFYPEPPQPGDG